MPAAVILVISDNADQVALMTLMLKDQGYDVRSIHRTQEGVAESVRQRPDVIIIPNADMDSPPDGFMLCHQLRNEETLSVIPILMITRTREKAIEAGADAWLGMFPPISELQNKVVELLTSQRRGTIR